MPIGEVGVVLDVGLAACDEIQSKSAIPAPTSSCPVTMARNPNSIVTFFFTIYPDSTPIAPGGIGLQEAIDLHL